MIMVVKMGKFNDAVEKLSDKEIDILIELFNNDKLIYIMGMWKTSPSHLKLHGKDMISYLKSVKRGWY